MKFISKADKMSVRISSVSSKSKESRAHRSNVWKFTTGSASSNLSARQILLVVTFRSCWQKSVAPSGIIPVPIADICPETVLNPISNPLFVCAMNGRQILFPPKRFVISLATIAPRTSFLSLFFSTIVSPVINQNKH